MTSSMDDSDSRVDASTMSTEDARSAWAVVARQVLTDKARTYNSVVTYKELSAAAMEQSGIHTRQLMHYWIGDVLGRVSAECESAHEPLLSSLAVNAEGSVGEGYAEGVLKARGTRPEDPDAHAAIERLECYRHFGANLPASGGTPTLTPRVKASRDRARRARYAEQVSPLCPKCHTEVPSTGICGYCD
jgi:hypothetical protein